VAKVPSAAIDCKRRASVTIIGVAIALDVGYGDPLRADNVNLDAALTRLRVAHRLEEYEGRSRQSHS